MDKVILMTMHSAKGWNSSMFMLPGWRIPFPFPDVGRKSKGTGRRKTLFYVALTRAEKLATLTYALNRYKWGNLERSKPSRFLREIDQNFLNILRPEENHS